MKRSEALSLVGQRVWAWTAANGEYIGILRRVTNERPFRADVEVRELASWPTPTDVGRFVNPRKPFREGRVINVGNSSVRPASSPERSWRESVIAVGRATIESLERGLAVRENSIVRTWPQHIREVVDALERGAAYCCCACHNARDPVQYRNYRGLSCCPHANSTQREPEQ